MEDGWCDFLNRQPIRADGASKTGSLLTAGGPATTVGHPGKTGRRDIFDMSNTTLGTSILS